MRVGSVLGSLFLFLFCFTPITSVAERVDFKGSEGGIVHAIVATPAHTSTLYAATSHAGVFKTLDGGNHWTPVNRGMHQVDVLALVQDPTSPGILFAGTRNGLYKTVDGAAHWQPVNAVIGDGQIKVLTFDAGAHRLYAGTQQGIWISDDAGTTWSQLAAQPADRNITALAIALDGAHSIYVGTSEGLFRSRAQDAAWTHVSQGLPVPSIATFAIDPTRPNIVYAGTGDGAYKSEDGGDSWYSITANQAKLPVTALLVDPRHPDTLYMGTSFVGGLFRSKDGGKSWQRIQGAEFTPAITALTFPTADTKRLIAGSSFYASVFISNDGGTNWKSTAGQLALPKLESITGTPDGGSVFAAAPDGIYWVDNTQQNWKWLGNTGVGSPTKIAYSKQHGGELWICGAKGVTVGQPSKGAWHFTNRLATSTSCIDLAEDANSDHLIAATKTEIWVGPGTWQRRTLPKGNTSIEHIAVDGLSGALYVMTEHRILRSADEGKHWQSFADNPAAVFTAMALSGGHPVIWMATDADITYRTADGKSTDISNGVFPPGISAMAASVEGNRIYAASGVLGRLFTRAMDQQMWSSSDLEGGAPEVSGLWVNPVHQGVLYVSTRNSGVFRSDDDGQHWIAANADLAKPTHVETPVHKAANRQ